MSTVIHLLNQDVRAVTGTVSGTKIEITGMYHAAVPEGIIANGIITNQEALEEFLQGFWEQHHLPKKDVYLGVGSASAVSRRIEIPCMTDKQIREYLPREFASVERTVDPVYTWIDLSKDGKKQTILASMQERSVLLQHVQMFKKLGIQLKSIQPEIISYVQLLRQISCLWDKSCVVQILDGMSVLNMVIVNGDFHMFSRSAVLSQRGTVGFGVECARIINNQQQFLRTQQVAETISDVYFAGFSADDYELAADSISQMDDTIQSHQLTMEASDGIVFGQGTEPDSAFLSTVGDLLSEKGKRNLYYQVLHDPNLQKRRRDLFMRVLPVGILTLVLAAFSVVQAVQWFHNTDRVNKIFDYMSNPTVQQAVADYDRLVQENSEMEQRTDVIDGTWRMVLTYPQYTSRVEQEISRCAAGIARTDVRSFSSIDGTIIVTAFTDDVDGMNRFVGRLEDETDLFDHVYYRGFEFDDSAGAWRAEITCYMTTPTTGEEQS